MELVKLIKDNIKIEMNGNYEPTKVVLDITLTNVEEIKELLNLLKNDGTEWHLEDLDLCVRTWNCIVRWFQLTEDKHHSEITLEDMFKLVGSDDFYKVKNLGKKSRKEILEKLEPYRK